MAPRRIDTHAFLLPLVIAAVGFDRRGRADGLRVVADVVALVPTGSVVACAAVGARGA